jgi:hypothetical protein
LCSGRCAGYPDRGQPVLTQPPEALKHPPGRRNRGHRSQQRVTADQQPQVAEAVAAISEHDDQIAQHLRRSVPASARPTTTIITDRELAQRAGQPESVSQLHQQRHARMADHPIDVDPVGVDGSGRWGL